MSELIIIKGNQFGLNVQMDTQSSFETLYDAFVTKLEQGRRFFGNSSVSIQFDGHPLNDEQKDKMVSAIGANTDMTVFCVVEPDMAVVPPKDFSTKLAMDEVEALIEEVEPEIEPLVIEPESREPLSMETAVFHQGTLRSGQELSVDTGIVIVGDVNPGAKVIAKGNIFVIGQLRGFAHAGYGGEEKACIFALNMSPTQMRIGRVIARSPDKFDEDAAKPQIAFLEENRIIIDHIDRTFYNSFQLLK